MWRRLGSSGGPGFDVLVIGGGATGGGCALDAASRGYRVALVERGDLASGTSSRATKMAHGGVRYLERALLQLDPGELGMVRDCLHERLHFFRVAPHLTAPLPLVTPCYTWWDAAKLFVGLRTYDILSGARRVGTGTQWLTPARVLEMAPHMATHIAQGSQEHDSDDDVEEKQKWWRWWWRSSRRLVGGVLYHDAVFNDARLAAALSLTAATPQMEDSEEGAVVLNHCEAVALIKDSSGRVAGAVVRDRLTGREQQVRARVVVNATGAYTDSIRQMDDPHTPPIARPSMGVHIVLDADRFCPTVVDHKQQQTRAGVLVPSTPDGRVMFVVPWEGRCIAGTTDAPVDLSETPAPREEDVEFIRSTMQDYYSVPIERSDIRSAWAGIRPLVSLADNNNSSNTSTTSAVRRDHHIEVSNSGLVTISGGKWTSFRLMAQETIDKAAQVGNLPVRESKSEVTPLVGAAHWHTVASRPQLVEGLSLDDDVRRHLASAYGDRAVAVAALAQERNLSRRLCADLPVIEAEVVYQVHHEMACTPTDVIAYRTNLMFLDREAAKQAVPRVAELMACELGWTSAQRAQYAQEAINYIEKSTI